MVLPYIEDYKPDASGISPLARHEEWYLTDCPVVRRARRAARRTSPTPSWTRPGTSCATPRRGTTQLPFDPEVTREWLPVDMYIGGNEHAVLHLLYSRFITMVLHDLGHVDFEEPFERFRAHGLIIKEGAKMSKSRGNVVVPDEYIEEYGADTFRTYLMFLGPYQEGGDFREAGITGPYNFLNRLWDTVLSAEERPLDAGGGAEAARHHPEGDGGRGGALLQHRHRGDDGVPERGARRRPHAGARRGGAAGAAGGALRPAPGGGAVGAARPRGLDLRAADAGPSSTRPRRWPTPWSSWCR